MTDDPKIIITEFQLTPPDYVEFERRVERYFNSEPREPAGRLILDLLWALRQATNAGLENKRLRELLGGCCDWIAENHTWLDDPYCLTVGRAALAEKGNGNA